MPKTKRAVRILCAALVILLISCIGASLVQTNFGAVTIRDLRFETASGHTMSALLLIPENATAETPAPAIVCSHGWFNNREMQDLNYVEYARRGYVVLSIDMYGHGNSEDIPNDAWWDPAYNANGMYDAVQMMASLPFVDAGRIGVTGHSNGALAARAAVLLDNEADEPLIAAALLVSNDALYRDEAGEYYNMFGSRDAAIVACQYDEFFHRSTLADGTTTPPREFIHQDTAQSFLYFGTDPAGKAERAPYTLYQEKVDGQDAIRAVFNPAIIHPWAHFSGGVVAVSAEFFEAALDGPKNLSPTDQIWQVKVAFNALGIVGMFTFMVGLALCLLETPFFEDLKADRTPESAVVPEKRDRRRVWIGLAAGVPFSMVMYLVGAVLGMGLAAVLPGVFKQVAPLGIGIWSLLCGLFTLLLLRGPRRRKGKESLAAMGIGLKGSRLWKTVLLGVLVAAGTYGTVFAADFFFKTDFRLWCLTFKAFDPGKLVIALPYLPFFLAYYIINSVANNCFNYVRMGKHKWVNTAVVALFNALSPVLLLVIFYGSFFATGFLPLENMGGGLLAIWLFPIAVILPLYAVVSRILYKATRNPYLPGVAMGIIVTVMSCTNTLTAL